MAREGVHVELPDLSINHTVQVPGGNGATMTTNAVQVILRADDALYSTLSPYRDNALDWWNWLDPNHQFESIEAFRRFIDTCDINRAKEYKDAIGQFFKALGCEGSDGAFKKVTDVNGIILPKVLNYRDVVGRIVGMSLNLPERYIIHKGRYAVQYAKPGYDMNVLHAENLYSYAFIFGPRPKYPNFSFTLDME